MVSSHNFPQRMDTGAMEQQQRDNFAHRGVNGICGVPARLSGLVSLAVQTVVMVISCLLVGVLFVHAGGYKYFIKNGTNVATETFLVIQSENEFANSMNITTRADQVATIFPTPLALEFPKTFEGENEPNGGFEEDSANSTLVGILPTIDEMATNNVTMVDADVLNATMAKEVEAVMNQENQTFNTDELKMIGGEIVGNLTNGTIASSADANTNASSSGSSVPMLHQAQSFDGPFEQIHPVQLRIGRAELDLLAMLRALCILYGCACLLWLISLIGLLISLKLEILDLVYVNTFLLAIVTVLLLINSIAGALLILYQTEYHWKLLVTISIIEGGFILCFVFNILAIIILVLWYRYIDYMNGGDEACICLSTLVGCIKRRRGVRSQRDRQLPEANYTIPEATRHAQLPYIDDPPVQQFSNF